MSKKTGPKFVVLPPDPLPDTGKGMEGFNKAISMDRQESRVAVLMPSSGKSLVRPQELNGTLQRIIEAQKQQFRKNQQAVAAHAEFYKRTGSTVPALNLRDIPHVETRETIKINNTASAEEYAKKLEELRTNAAEKAAREERKWIERGWAVPRDQMYQRVVRKEQNIIEHYPRTKIFHPYATKLDEEKEVKHYDPEARRWNSRVKEEEERTNRALMGIIAPTKRLAVTRKSHQRSYVRTEKEERGIPAESLLGQVKEEPDIKQEVEEYPGEQLPEYHCQMNPDVEVKQELESEPTATAYITLLKTPFPPIKVEPHVKGEILSDDYPDTSQKVVVVDGRVIVPLVSPLAAMKLPPSLPMDPKGRRIVRYPLPPRHLFWQ